MQIWDFLILSGGLFSWVLMVGTLWVPNRKTSHLLLASIYFLHGVIAIDKGLACAGLILNYPVLMHMDLLAFYLIGPMVFLYLQQLINCRGMITLRYGFLLFPAFLFVLLYLPFFKLNPSLKVLQYPFYIFAQNPLHRIRAVTGYLLPSLFMILFSLAGLQPLSLKKTFQFMKSRKDTRLILCLIVEITLLSFMMMSAVIFWSYSYYRVIILALNQVILCVFWIHQRYPELYQQFSDQIEALKKEKSHLSGLPVNHLLEQLEKKLSKEKVYLDGDLTLRELAESIKLNPHQLSELLNRHKNCSFRQLINQWRIQEAEEQLKQFPQKSILEIAFDSGFKSKSSFNTLFREHTGQTPSVFRKE